MPDNISDDIGATHMSTGRSQRIDEMISGWIKEGHKITVADMQAIQQDDTDVIAREFTPRMIKAARGAVTELEADERASMEAIIGYLEGWDGRFQEESIAATCYSYTMLFFYRSLMHKFSGDETQRLKMVDNYNFVDFTERMLLNIDDAKFNVVCEQAYEGHSTCSYNLARAFQ